ncbi:hypothetical protein [Bacillus thermotolerans]|uniref:Uncharacterized protein n=1 Tax=Bacillus thermotolerans TaxID=1221996 RepID=A0A0F5HMQ0_BACTR|nr:hypothetical protein [Bacillus thermotolerans]KKB34325.1 hypothetical protein QY95_03936 [Bacillus thermotolerans]KKB37880.1 hypothetical protein QY97_03785 [Bacillus thermotolerans]
MGLTSILMGLFGMILVMTFFLPLLMVKKHGKGPSPYKGSYCLFGLLIINWILYVTGFYTLLPANVADLMFIPMWLTICALSAVFALLEFRNNKAFAVPLAGFTFISFVFALFLNGLSHM